MRMLRWPLACLLLVGCVSLASAHYLWVAINIYPRNAEHIDITFEEGPRLGDGHYLDPFLKTGKAWIRTPDNLKPTPVELREMTIADEKNPDDKKKRKRWLTGTLPVQGDVAIDTRGTFGVYRYPRETDVMLYYNAKHLRVSSEKNLKALARAGDHLDVDIVPSVAGKTVKLQVLWKGKPVADRTVRIRGGGLSQNLRTDETGSVEFEPLEPALHTFHTYIELKGEQGAGTHDGKKHTLTRHHGTLSMRLPLEK